MPIRAIRLSRPAAAALSIVLLAVVAAGDYATGPYLIFDLFYLLPLLITTWYLKRRWGLVMAVIASGVWVAMQIASGHPPTHPLMWFWNLSVRVAVSWLIVWLVSRLKDDLAEQARLVGDLRTAVDQIKQLNGLLPLCAWCKKIRDDKGYWLRLEQYIQDHTDAQITHGICPDCATKLVSDMKQHREAE
jgi:hypothetical protein